ncbi:hypothetical protein IJG89_03340 [Candidatus Saccharibacteria bacterium]|nr:hypothetical protein [Candidatus Saccharibacteria bacterium]
MDDYLIDRKFLAEFVDNLIKQKPTATDNDNDIDAIREKAIRELDDKIGMAIFGKFTKEQNEEYNRILDDDNLGSDAIASFFDKIGLNPSEIVTQTMEEYGKDFLGGKND